jgi:heat shock protein HslJ
MLKYLLVPFLFFSFAHTTMAQWNDISKIVGIVWKAEGKEGDIVFKDDKTLGGYDGCNSYGGSYTFTPKKGFDVRNLVSTERFCEPQDNMFQYGFLYSATEFRLKKKTLIFYNKDRKVVARLQQQKNPPKK